MKHLFCILMLLVITANLSAQNNYPEPRYAYSLAAVYDSVKQCNLYYIFGGSSTESMKKDVTGIRSLNDIYCYDPSICLFNRIIPAYAVGSDTIPGMYGHNALSYKGEIFIFNGHRSVAADSSVYTYEPATNTITQLPGQVPYFKEHVFACGDNSGSDSIFIFAGGMNSDSTAANQCWEYNAEQNAWTQKMMMQYGGRYAGAGTKMSITSKSEKFIDVRAIVFAGLTEYGVQNAVFVYEYIANNWSWFNLIGDPLYGMCGVAWDEIGNYMIAMGGAALMKGGKSVDLSTDLYTLAFDFSSSSATAKVRASNLPPSWFGAGWITVENTDTLFYNFGGISQITTSGDTITTNNFYRYNITDNIIEQYDTTTMTWGGLITLLNEQEFAVSEELSIYPNPVNNTAMFTLATSEKVLSVKVYNQNGQLIRQEFNPDVLEINLSGKKAGVYYVRVDTEKNFYLGKILKH